MRVVFMGSPGFAVASLDALCRAGHDVAAVVSQRDKVRGRHKEICPTPVKAYALQYDLPCHTPDSIRDPDFISRIRDLRADCIVVTAYGKLLPKALLAMCPYGAINVHGSLLPAYRGPSPIYQALYDGATETGVTTMYMAEGLDNGDICLQETYPLDDTMVFGDVYDALARTGGGLLVRTLALLAAGKAPRIAQEEGKATHTRLLTRADEAVDWNRPGDAVARQIRALSPEPGAYGLCGDKPVKLLDAAFVPGESPGTPGAILGGDREAIFIAVPGGRLRICRLKPQGKNEMRAADWLRGRRGADPRFDRDRKA